MPDTLLSLREGEKFSELYRRVLAEAIRRAANSTEPVPVEFTVGKDTKFTYKFDAGQESFVDGMTRADPDIKLSDLDAKLVKRAQEDAQFFKTQRHAKELVPEPGQVLNPELDITKKQLQDAAWNTARKTPRAPAAAPTPPQPRIITLKDGNNSIQFRENVGHGSYSLEPVNQKPENFHRALRALSNDANTNGDTAMKWGDKTLKVPQHASQEYLDGLCTEVGIAPPAHGAARAGAAEAGQAAGSPALSASDKRILDEFMKIKTPELRWARIDELEATGPQGVELVKRLELEQINHVLVVGTPDAPMPPATAPAPGAPAGQPAGPAASDPVRPVGNEMLRQREIKIAEAYKELSPRGREYLKASLAENAGERNAWLLERLDNIDRGALPPQPAAAAATKPAVAGPAASEPAAPGAGAATKRTVLIRFNNQAEAEELAQKLFEAGIQNANARAATRNPQGEWVVEVTDTNLNKYLNTSGTINSHIQDAMAKTAQRNSVILHPDRLITLNNRADAEAMASDLLEAGAKNFNTKPVSRRNPNGRWAVQVSAEDMQLDAVQALLKKAEGPTPAGPAAGGAGVRAADPASLVELTPEEVRIRGRYRDFSQESRATLRESIQAGNNGEQRLARLGFDQLDADFPPARSGVESSQAAGIRATASRPIQSGSRTAQPAAGAGPVPDQNTVAGRFSRLDADSRAQFLANPSNEAAVREHNLIEVDARLRAAQQPAAAPDPVAHPPATGAAARGGPGAAAPVVPPESAELAEAVRGVPRSSESYTLTTHDGVKTVACETLIPEAKDFDRVRQALDKLNIKYELTGHNRSAIRIRSAWNDVFTRHLKAAGLEPATTTLTDAQAAVIMNDGGVLKDGAAGKVIEPALKTPETGGAGAAGPGAAAGAEQQLHGPDGAPPAAAAAGEAAEVPSPARVLRKAIAEVPRVSLRGYNANSSEALIPTREDFNRVIKALEENGIHNDAKGYELLGETGNERIIRISSKSHEKFLRITKQEAATTTLSAAEQKVVRNFDGILRDETTGAEINPTPKPAAASAAPASSVTPDPDGPNMSGERIIARPKPLSEAAHSPGRPEHNLHLQELENRMLDTQAYEKLRVSGRPETQASLDADRAAALARSTEGLKKPVRVEAGNRPLDKVFREAMDNAYLKGQTTIVVTEPGKTVMIKPTTGTLEHPFEGTNVREAWAQFRRFPSHGPMVLQEGEPVGTFLESAVAKAKESGKPINVEIAGKELTVKPNSKFVDVWNQYEQTVRTGPVSLSDTSLGGPTEPAAPESAGKPAAVAPEDLTIRVDLGEQSVDKVFRNALRAAEENGKTTIIQVKPGHEVTIKPGTTYDEAWQQLTHPPAAAAPGPAGPAADTAPPGSEPFPEASLKIQELPKDVKPPQTLPGGPGGVAREHNSNIPPEFGGPARPAQAAPAAGGAAGSTSRPVREFRSLNEVFSHRDTITEDTDVIIRPPRTANSPNPTYTRIHVRPGDTTDTIQQAFREAPRLRQIQGVELEQVGAGNLGFNEAGSQVTEFTYRPGPNTSPQQAFNAIQDEFKANAGLASQPAGIPAGAEPPKPARITLRVPQEGTAGHYKEAHVRNGQNYQSFETDLAKAPTRTMMGRQEMTVLTSTDGATTYQSVRGMDYDTTNDVFKAARTHAAKTGEEVRLRIPEGSNAYREVTITRRTDVAALQKGLSTAPIYQDIDGVKTGLVEIIESNGRPVYQPVPGTSNEAAIKAAQRLAENTGDTTTLRIPRSDGAYQDVSIANNESVMTLTDKLKHTQTSIDLGGQKWKVVEGQGKNITIELPGADYDDAARVAIKAAKQNPKLNLTLRWSDSEYSIPQNPRGASAVTANDLVKTKITVVEVAPGTGPEQCAEIAENLAKRAQSEKIRFKLRIRNHELIIKPVPPGTDAASIAAATKEADIGVSNAKEWGLATARDPELRVRLPDGQALVTRDHAIELASDDPGYVARTRQEIAKITNRDAKVQIRHVDGSLDPTPVTGTADPGMPPVPGPARPPIEGTREFMLEYRQTLSRLENEAKSHVREGFVEQAELEVISRRGGGEAIQNPADEIRNVAARLEKEAEVHRRQGFVDDATAKVTARESHGEVIPNKEAEIQKVADRLERQAEYNQMQELRETARDRARNVVVQRTTSTTTPEAPPRTGAAPEGTGEAAPKPTGPAAETPPPGSKPFTKGALEIQKAPPGLEQGLPGGTAGVAPGHNPNIPRALGGAGQPIELDEAELERLAAESELQLHMERVTQDHAIAERGILETRVEREIAERSRAMMATDPARATSMQDPNTNEGMSARNAVRSSLRQTDANIAETEFARRVELKIAERSRAMMASDPARATSMQDPNTNEGMSARNAVRSSLRQTDARTARAALEEEALTRMSDRSLRELEGHGTTGNTQPAHAETMPRRPAAPATDFSTEPGWEDAWNNYRQKLAELEPDAARKLALQNADSPLSKAMRREFSGHSDKGALEGLAARAEEKITTARAVTTTSKGSGAPAEASTGPAPPKPGAAAEIPKPVERGGTGGTFNPENSNPNRRAAPALERNELGQPLDTDLPRRPLRVGGGGSQKAGGAKPPATDAEARHLLRQVRDRLAPGMTSEQLAGYNAEDQAALRDIRKNMMERWAHEPPNTTKDIASFEQLAKNLDPDELAALSPDARQVANELRERGVGSTIRRVLEKSNGTGTAPSSKPAAAPAAETNATGPTTQGTPAPDGPRPTGETLATGAVGAARVTMPLEEAEALARGAGELTTKQLAGLAKAQGAGLAGALKPLAKPLGIAAVAAVPALGAGNKLYEEEYKAAKKGKTLETGDKVRHLGEGAIDGTLAMLNPLGDGKPPELRGNALDKSLAFLARGEENSVKAGSALMMGEMVTPGAQPAILPTMIATGLHMLAQGTVGAAQEVVYATGLSESNDPGGLFRAGEAFGDWGGTKLAGGKPISDGMQGSLPQSEVERISNESVNHSPASLLRIKEFKNLKTFLHEQGLQLDPSSDNVQKQIGLAREAMQGKIKGLDADKSWRPFSNGAIDARIDMVKDLQNDLVLFAKVVDRNRTIQQEKLKEFDKDGDGRLTLNDFDKNHDGKIDAGERYDILRASNAAADKIYPSVLNDAERDLVQAELLKQFDKDGDGKLTVNDFDKNKNGKIDAGELDAFQKAEKAAIQQVHPDRPGDAEKRPRGADRDFENIARDLRKLGVTADKWAEFDKDGDGAITLKDFDKNKNGKIDAGELRDIREAEKLALSKAAAQKPGGAVDKDYTEIANKLNGLGVIVDAAFKAPAPAGPTSTPTAKDPNASKQVK